MRGDQDTKGQLVALEQQLRPLEPQFGELMTGTDLTPQRMVRSILFQAETNPKLLLCTRASLIRASYTGAILALPADGFTGQGFLVPFNRKGVGQIAQWITGYKGYVTLGARAGLTIDGGVVREGDEFDFAEGTRAFVHHKKKLGAGLGRRLIAAYAQATAPGRAPIVKVLDLDEIMAVKQKSAAARKDASAAEDTETFSPWNDQAVGFPAMAEKTAKRRLSRSLPLLTLDFMRFHMAARVDEAHEEQGHSVWADPHAMHGEPGVVIDGKAEPLVSDTQPPSRGIEAEELQRPAFLIRGVRGDTRVNTIEQWRARMMEALSSASYEAAMQVWDKNAALIDEYRDKYPDEVRAVGRVYEERRQKGR